MTKVPKLNLSLKKWEELGLICEVITLLSPSSEKKHLILQNEPSMLSTLLGSLIYCISKSNLNNVTCN